MKCPKCGKESEGAFCPECGTPLQETTQETENVNSKPRQSYQMAQQPEKKKKKGGCLKIVLIVFAVIVVLAIIGTIFGSDDTDSNDDSNTSTTSETVNSETTGDTKTETTPDADSKESEQQEEDYISVGSSFEVDNLKITVNEADTNFTNYDDTYGYYTPEDGMKYIMVSFTFENIGDSGDEYVSIYDFDCYADNSNCEQEYLPDGSDFMNTNLSSGRNVSFKTYYAVPVNAQSIELEYTENVWSDKKVLIKIQ